MSTMLPMVILNGCTLRMRRELIGCGDLACNDQALDDAEVHVAHNGGQDVVQEFGPSLQATHTPKPTSSVNPHLEPDAIQK